MKELDDEPPDDGDQEIDALLRAGVRASLAEAGFAPALERFAGEFAALAPRLAGGIVDGGERGAAFAIFREIWNHTPRPEQGWKIAPLPKPDRNTACPCGSGKKFKQCCGWMEGGPRPFGPRPPSMLGYVLETLPPSAYGGIPFNRLNPEEVGFVAHDWGARGRVAEARALLEAQLKPGGKFDARHEFSFDELCSLHLDAGDEAARTALVERFMQSPDRALKVAATHRRCTMHADAGEHDAAWALFQDAQRLDPDNPALAQLEILLLANQGKPELVAARATFWAKRLTRLDADPELIEFMREAADDPESVLEMMHGEFGDADADDEYDDAAAAATRALCALVATLPPARCLYRLEGDDTDAGPLLPAAELERIESDWRALLDDLIGGDPDEAPRPDAAMVEFLAAEPDAWHNFAVIEDVVAMLADEVLDEEYDDILDAVELRLVDRAVDLLRLAIAESGGRERTLEWGWLQNRPALRLVAWRINLATDKAEELALLEWLVLTLNPNDNTGHRVVLAHRLCAAGRAADALALCDERYPDDGLAGMRYARVLALRLLDRRAEATAALADAAKRYPKVLKTLLAKRPKPPALRSGVSTVGGEDEAWYYRQDYLDAWESTGAMAWLREVGERRR